MTDPISSAEILDVAHRKDRELGISSADYNGLSKQAQKFQDAEINEAEFQELRRQHGLDESGKPIHSALNTLRSMEVTMKAIQKIDDATFVIPNLLTTGAVNTWVAPHESGKTALARYAANSAAEQGYEVFYFDVDSPAFVAKEMKILAHEEGWRYFNPDVMVGQSVDGYLRILNVLARDDGNLNKMLFIFDTAKKFTDSIISKAANKKLTTLMRSLAVRGAAVLILGHTNKFRDSDGNLVPEGTNEVMTDVDTLLIFEVEKDLLAGVQTVSTITDRSENPFVKNRFAFRPITFEIALAKHLKDRTVTIKGDYIDLKESNLIKEDQQSDMKLITAIKGAMYTLTKDGQVCIQSRIVEAISSCGQNTIVKVLNKYDGSLWSSSKGMNNAKVFTLKD